MNTIKRHSLFLLLICLIFASCNNPNKVYESTNAKNKKKKFDVTVGKFNKLVKSSDMDKKYEAALKYYDKNDFSKALILLEELMSVFRGTTRGEEVHYYYAYCNYSMDDYLVAGYQFRNFAKLYPNSKHAEECAYMNAYCFYLNSPEYSLDQIDTKLAIKEFQRFTNIYPKSTRIEECNTIIDKLRGKLERKSYENAMLYYNMGYYKAATVAFANHIKDFPDSRHIEELNYLTIKSHYLYAINSIDTKKVERFKNAIDSYNKFVEAFPKSSYLREAETINTSAQKNLEKLTKTS
jgi:outer membrane protein assembly factor BamD